MLHVASCVNLGDEVNGEQWVDWETYLCSSVLTENFLQLSFSPFSTLSSPLFIPHTRVLLCNHALLKIRGCVEYALPGDELPCSLARPRPCRVPARRECAAVCHQIHGIVSSRGWVNGRSWRTVDILVCSLFLSLKRRLRHRRGLDHRR